MTHKAQGVFVTGTDTGVGKTEVACALLRIAGRTGWHAVGMKPVAAGARRVRGRRVNADVSSLAAASSVRVPDRWRNPYLLVRPNRAPHCRARSGYRVADRRDRARIRRALPARRLRRGRRRGRFLRAVECARRFGRSRRAPALAGGAGGRHAPGLHLARASYGGSDRAARARARGLGREPHRSGHAALSRECCKPRCASGCATLGRDSVRCRATHAPARARVRARAGGTCALARTRPSQRPIRLEFSSVLLRLRGGV